MSNKIVPDLVVTRGDGVALPDQKAALAEFKEQALSKSADDIFRGSDEKLIQTLQDRVFDLEADQRRLEWLVQDLRYIDRHVVTGRYIVGQTVSGVTPSNPKFKDTPREAIDEAMREAGGE